MWRDRIVVYLPCTIPHSKRIHSDDFYVDMISVMEKMDAHMTSFRALKFEV